MSHSKNFACPLFFLWGFVCLSISTSPYNLCQGLLPAGQCAKIFPKSIPAEYKKQASEILSLLAQPTVDQGKISALCDKLPQLDPANSASLRVDIAIENPSNHKVYLVDNAFLHSSCAGYRMESSRMFLNELSLQTRPPRRTLRTPYDGSPPSQ